KGWGSRRPGGRARRSRSRLELRRRRALGARGRLEVRALLEPSEARHDYGRERLAESVVDLRRLVEAVARDGDPVLGPLELDLEVAAVLVRLQLRALR